MNQKKIKVVTACGVGMGSSLMLKMMIEEILSKEKIPSIVENMDIGSLKGLNPDILVVQKFHEDKVKGLATVIIPIENFLDKAKLKEKMMEGIKSLGINN